MHRSAELPFDFVISFCNHFHLSIDIRGSSKSFKCQKHEDHSWEETLL